MKNAEPKLHLEALPANELARSLLKERVLRAGLTLGAAYFLYGGFYMHGLAEDAIQTLKAQGEDPLEVAYRMAQGTGWIGSIAGTSFFSRFALKAHERVEQLESAPSFRSSTTTTQEPESLAAVRRIQ